MGLITEAKMARCRYCGGCGKRRKLVIRNNNLKYEIVGCPRCNGTGREQKERKREKRT